LDGDKKEELGDSLLRKELMTSGILAQRRFLYMLTGMGRIGLVYIPICSLLVRLCYCILGTEYIYMKST
jgi:hypothetical protein